MIPGEYFLSREPIVANQGKKTVKIKVTNKGDRPIQVGSHTHFFEVNRALFFKEACVWISPEHSLRYIYSF
jgi:urease subunit beta